MIDPSFQKWWTLQGDVPFFEDVLWRVYAEHREQLLQHVFRRNRTAGRTPTSFKELGEALAGNGNHLRKGHGIPIPRLPLWADVLNVEIAAMYPDRVTWLVRATRRLSPDLDLNESDVVLYVQYLLADPRSSNMDEVALRQVENCIEVRNDISGVTSQEIAEAIVRVVAQLRPLFETLCRRES